MTLVALSPLALAAKPSTRPAAPAKLPQASAGLGVTGRESFFSLPDPQMPGKFKLQVRAKGLSGNWMGSGISGVLNGVTAILFERGVPAARLTAPKMQGDNLQNKVVATGRVTIKSLSQAGRTLTADRITWYPKTNDVYADGNVVLQDSKTGAVVRNNHLRANTALKTIKA